MKSPKVHDSFSSLNSKNSTESERNGSAKWLVRPTEHEHGWQECPSSFNIASHILSFKARRHLVLGVVGSVNSIGPLIMIKKFVVSESPQLSLLVLR